MLNISIHSIDSVATDQFSAHTTSLTTSSSSSEHNVYPLLTVVVLNLVVFTAFDNPSFGCARRPREATHY